MKYTQSLKLGIAWLRWLFTPLALYFIAYLAWTSRALLAELYHNAQVIWLVYSVLLWGALHFISPLFTILVFKGFSSPINYTSAFFIHTNRLPAKYLPGGIWHTVARTADYYAKGLDKRHIGSYLLIENVAVAGVTLTIGGAVVAGLSEIGGSWLNIAIAASSMSICTIVVLPWFLNQYILVADKPMNKTLYAQGICCFVVYWIIAGTAFICFLLAFPEISLQVSMIEAAGIYIFSWGIGFVTIISPQGIGIAEFVSSQLLGAEIATGGFIIFLAGFRLIGLIGDLTIWTVSKITYRFT